MLFNSYKFILVYLPLFLVGVFCATRIKNEFGKIALVFCSLLFYAHWDYRYLVLLLCSVLVNYFVSSQPSFNRNRNLLSILIALNLFNIFIFKYYAYISSIIESGVRVKLPHFSSELPLGISFYTFQQIAYLVNKYKSKEEKKNLTDFMLFITFFPHVLAGPIVLDRDFFHQLKERKFLSFSYFNLMSFFAFFSVGMAKKVLIADRLSDYAHTLFSAGQAQLLSFTVFDYWVGVLCYALQIYFDFSGYSDMAIGLARLFGIKFPFNFNSPYKAKNLVDFWTRWHMSLSKFLRDYLYIPLGGNRYGRFNKYRNIFITMFLGGGWHGAAHVFFLWGIMHGIGIIINHIFIDYKLKFPRLLSRPLTLIYVMLCWVPFRARSVDFSIQIWKGMFKFGDFSWFSWNGILDAKREYLLVLFSLILVIYPKNTSEVNPRIYKSKVWAMYIGGILILSLLHLGKIQKFIYYQF